jgi:signal transduction histidine kinase/CheY-like chemotaxis protein
VTPPEVRARIIELMRERGQRLAPALLVTFVFYVVADDLLGYATPGFPYVFAWCAAVVLAFVTGAFVFRRVPDRWVHVASASLLWCTTSSTLVTLSVTPLPGPVLLLVIQIVSAGVLLHTRWVIATLAAIVAAAVPLLGAIPGMPATMAIAAVVTAAGFAFLIHRLLLAAVVRTMSLHEQLLHAQRMEAVGTLAAGIAHDMNNVLASISNLAALLVESAPREQRADLGQIIDQASRGAQLTRGLLAFSRRGQYRKEVLAYGARVREMLPLLQRMLPKSIEVRDEIAVGDARVEGDAVHLGQVLVNLALNAADAMRGSGTLSIRAVREPGRVVLSVTDTGHGMDAATRLRVFEPFFTTKPIGQGSGLGLSIVWGIVQAHGGTIDVHSEVGTGSTFTVCLPTTNAPLAAVPAVPPAMPASMRGTVLVVADEAPVRDTSRRLLARMGLEVLTACTGEEALAVVADRAADIRAVVLDMGMPGMGGAACFRELRKHSSVPVLIATGYAADENMHELFAAGARIIEKPYAAADLRREITLLLEARADYRRSRGITRRPRA